MAGVNNSSRRFSNHGFECQPYEHVQSMGDDFIEELVDRQKDKNYSLQRLICEEKEFQSSHSYKPITEYNKGTSSLQSFVSQVVGNEPSEADEALKPKDPYLGLSRHEFDILQSVKPNSDTTKLLTFALRNKKSENNTGKGAFIPQNHPINHLQDIHDHKFTCGNPQKTAKTILRKRKQLLQYHGKLIGPEPKPSKPYSLWDVKELSSHPPKKCYTAALPSKNYKFTSSADMTNPGDKIKAKQHNFQSKIENTPRQNSPQKKPEDNGGRSYVAPSNCQLSEADLRIIPRFSEEEIRMIPRFQNWSRGEPSKSIYIKNLSSSVTEEDLASIFQHYQDLQGSRIVYRLMKTGKMRGQAFVDFHSVPVAEKALSERNGLALKDKPIVIQFARNKE